MDYEINSEIVPLSFGTQLSKGDIIILWNKQDDQHFQYIVEHTTTRYILAKKMSSKGIPIKVEERKTFKFTPETFQNNKLFLITDKTNDKHLWPTTLPNAILKLKLLYNNQELSLIKLMTWPQFDDQYNQFGGLSMWIRNYFGLYRGNFDLGLDCKIEEPSADNASSIIVYYFWEHIKDTE
jgi:hypothetical protein